MSYRDTARIAPDPLGGEATADSLAIRDRLCSAYKGLAIVCPKALDHHAVLNDGLHGAREGRMRAIMLSAGLTPSQYQHFTEGLSGDGYPVALLCVLIEAAPAAVAGALNDVFEPLGFEVKRKDQRSPLASLHEAGARLTERASSLQASYVRAIADGAVDRDEAAQLRALESSLSDALRDLRAHLGRV